MLLVVWSVREGGRGTESEAGIYSWMGRETCTHMDLYAMQCACAYAGQACVHARARPKCAAAPFFAQTRSKCARGRCRAPCGTRTRARARADGGRLGRRRTLAKREVNASDMSSRCSVHRPEHPSTAPGRIASSAHNRSAAALACASREITQTGIKAPPRGVPGACVRPRAPLIVAPW